MVTLTRWLEVTTLAVQQQTVGQSLLSAQFVSDQTDPSHCPRMGNLPSREVWELLHTKMTVEKNMRNAMLRTALALTNAFHSISFRRYLILTCSNSIKCFLKMLHCSKVRFQSPASCCNNWIDNPVNFTSESFGSFQTVQNFLVQFQNIFGTFSEMSGTQAKLF